MVPNPFFKEPQKALHLYIEEKKKKPNIEHDYIITEKLDGWYGFIDYIDGSGWQFPRNENRVIPSWMWTKEHFENSIPKPHVSTRFIFEAYILDTPFHILNGIFNRKFEKAEDVQFIIHDIIELGKFNCVANERYKVLTQTGLPLYHGEEKQILSISPILDITKYKTKWDYHFEQVINRGGEGIILKRVDGIFQPGKRNSSLMKIKLENSFDLNCVDMFWSKGEKGETSLNLTLENKKGTQVVVRVGKHKDILEFTTKESPVGKVVMIKAMKELEDGSYREPRFSCVRNDKLYGDID